VAPIYTEFLYEKGQQLSAFAEFV